MGIVLSADTNLEKILRLKKTAVEKTKCEGVECTG